MQLFSPKFWGDVHGGSTHFPIALLVAATVFDLAALLIRRRSEERAKDLQSAGFYTLLLGALISFAAVLSGLIVVGWETLGTGTLGLHHLYVWPAFGLLIAVAIWRTLVRNRASPPSLVACVAVEIIATVLMLLAGYQGGVLLQGGTNPEPDTGASEGRAALIAAVAAAAILGLTFGVSALMRGVTNAPPAVTPTASASVASPSVTPSAADLATGKRIFAEQCSSCHGDAGAGGYAPNLHKSTLDRARITTIIQHGVPGKMPAFGSKLSPAAVQQTAAYVDSLRGH